MKLPRNFFKPLAIGAPAQLAKPAGKGPFRRSFWRRDAPGFMSHIPNQYSINIAVACLRPNSATTISAG